MIYAEQVFHDCINSPVRHVKGRVELYEGSTLLETFCSTDKLKSFSVERVGEESKFFGYGICQKLTVKLLDRERQINVNEHHTLEAVFGTDCHYVYTNPLFHVTEMNRDEITNELTVIGYDALYKAAGYTVSDILVEKPYTVEVFAAACAAKLGLPLNVENLPDAFKVVHQFDPNFEGTETLRDCLDAIAEVTQTIYYIDHNWELTFKRLDIDGEPVVTIDKSKYFNLDSSVPCVLTRICSTTELDDNVYAGSEEGYTQYIRNNPFWTLRDDIGDLVLQGAAAVIGLSINQFDCSWRGNYLVEIGDKIAITTKDNELIYSYLLNDSITYDGSLKQKTQWSYNESEAESASNPATLGDALKYTYAKVDKVNRQIELVSSEVAINSEMISSIKLNTDNITASVSQLQENVNVNNENIQGEIMSIKNEVSAKMTSEEVKITISEELSNGVDKVATSTGFTFDQEGLTIEKSGSEMATQITEDGMTVYRNNEGVLIANNEGVKAEDLQATTYLIIGKNSRFEDYSNRTGCFWIGG